MKNIKTSIQVEIIFRGMNLDYDQDYADQYNFGKESEKNIKVNWKRSVSSPFCFRFKSRLFQGHSSLIHST